GPVRAPVVRAVRVSQSEYLGPRQQEAQVTLPQRYRRGCIGTLIRKRSLVQVQVGPPPVSPGQRTWALLREHRPLPGVPHPRQMSPDRLAHQEVPLRACRGGPAPVAEALRLIQLSLQLAQPGLVGGLCRAAPPPPRLTPNRPR